MATLFTPPRFTPVDGSGNVYAGAKLYFYLTGTTTPVDTYADSGLLTPNANPVVADANGLFASIYLDNSTVYKAVLKTSADVTVWTVDPLTSLTSAAIIAALGYTPANSAASATSYMAADVALNNVSNFFDGPNTGSIGASGQKWFILAKAGVTDTAGAATFSCQLHDGTNVVDTGAASIAAANHGATITFGKVITLSGATTFTLKVKDVTSTSGILSKSNDGGTTSFATSITAIRLS